MATLIQDTVSEKSSLSSQVEAVGSGLARYGLAVVVSGSERIRCTTLLDQSRLP